MGDLPPTDLPLGEPQRNFPPSCGYELNFMGCLIRTPLPHTSSPMVTCILTGRMAVVAFGIGTPLMTGTNHYNLKVRILIGY